MVSTQRDLRVLLSFSIWELQDSDLNYHELGLDEVIGLTRYEEINGEHYIDLTTTRQIRKGTLVCVLSPIDNRWREYVVWSESATHENNIPLYTYRCVWSLQGLLSVGVCNVMPGTSGGGVTAWDALRALLHSMASDEPSISAPFLAGNSNITKLSGASFWRMSGWEALGKLVETWGGEVDCRLEFSGENKTYDNSFVRYVDVWEPWSAKPTFWYEYGHEPVVKITRKQADSPTVCRIIPLGAAQETSTGGYGRKIDISSVNGGKIYLEDTEAWGHSRFTYPQELPALIVENGEITEPAALKTWGQSVLESFTREHVTYNVEAQEQSEASGGYLPLLGDFGYIIDDELDMRVLGRIQAISANELAKTIKATIATTTGDVSALAKLAGGTFGQTTVTAPDVRTSLISSPGDLLLEAGGYGYTIGADGYLHIDRASGDVMLSTSRTDKGVTCRFGVGSGGVNHGVFSVKQNRWLIHGDASNVYIGGTKVGALAYKDSLTVSPAVLSLTAKNSAAVNSGANVQINVSGTVPANCYVVGVGACVSNNANMVSRGFDVDGFAPGTTTVKTYWRNVGSSTIAANAATITVQVVYIKTSNIA